MGQTPDFGGQNRWQSKALHIQGEMADKADNDRSHVALVSVPLSPLNKEIKTQRLLQKSEGSLTEKCNK